MPIDYIIGLIGDNISASAKKNDTEYPRNLDEAYVGARGSDLH